MSKTLSPPSPSLTPWTTKLTAWLQYHQYRHGRYPIPNDDEEQNRDDMKHAMMLELTE